MVMMHASFYIWSYFVVLCVLNSGANSSNDTTVENISPNPNQIVISEKLFHLLIGVSLLVFLCCGCILLSCCISIWYHYQHKYKSIQEIDIKREIELKQIQSNSHISSLHNNASCEDNLLDIDSYDEIESTATKSLQSKNNLSPMNRRTQSVPINTQQINKLQLNNKDIILKLPLSYEGNNQLYEYINKQRKITSGGIILPKENEDLKSDYKRKRSKKNNNNKRFNSEELYENNNENDIKSSMNSRDITPFGNTPNDKNDIAIDDSNGSCDSGSTFTLKTIENINNNTKKSSIQLIKPNGNNNENNNENDVNNNNNNIPASRGEMNVVLEVYDNEMEISKENESESVYTMDGYNSRNSKSKQTIITENSEGYKITNKQKLNDLKSLDINRDEIKQYEIHHNHIPDIREESDFDIQIDDDCKSIHHDTVKKHKKKIKIKNKNKNKNKYNYKNKRQYNQKYKHKYNDNDNNKLNIPPSPHNTDNTSDDDDVLIGINDKQTPKGNNNIDNKMAIKNNKNNNNNSPFQPIQNNHYHTQPNLKYVNNNNNKHNSGIWLKPLQPPFIIDDKINKPKRCANK